MVTSVPTAVFDLDGTLIDSVPDVCAALNRLLVEEGRRPLADSEVATLVGEGPEALLDRAWRLTGAPVETGLLSDRIERYLAFYRAEPAERTVIFPGVRDALADLRGLGWQLVICTNKPHRMTGIVLDALGLTPLFDGWLGGDAVPRRKPHGDHILDCLRLVAGSANSAVMIGDSATDVQAARNAGLPVAVVGFGYDVTDVSALGADQVFDHYDSLAGILTGLLAANRQRVG